jgi:hypothetical protein
VIHHLKAVLGTEEGREAFNAAVEAVRGVIDSLQKEGGE